MSAATIVRLEGELTIYRAAELKPQLLPLPAGREPVEVDLSAVSEIDTAGVQLLLMMRREARADARDLRCTGHGAAVNDALTLLGLHAQLGAEATDAATTSATATPAATDAQPA